MVPHFATEIDRMTPTIFVISYLFDWILGDPEWFPHPVRLIGFLIRHGEAVLWKAAKSKSGEFIAGMLLSIVVVSLTGVGSFFILRFLMRWNILVGSGVMIYLAITTMATRNLIDEARSVNRCLKSGDIAAARKQLARIVGRDTHNLMEPEIVRATIETLAESASDGIVAPMFYLAIGGVPAALAYKAVNTLDSMIGHNDSRYRYFGKFAARMDDVANFIPARMTAALIVIVSLICGFDHRGSIQVWMRDAAKHASPNAGRPEAAMAGALKVRLGGLNYYDGAPHQGAYFGTAEKALDNKALQSSIYMIIVTSVLMFVLVLGCLVLQRFLAKSWI
ncbi:MAG TPA: adenosylcobinamide-phosphate synthase CbiB [Blastocatellia bacterium]|nr:adenosylcobinamide-phosphate synthase CbiB [Blastocatellia bacterium]